MVCDKSNFIPPSEYLEEVKELRRWICLVRADVEVLRKHIGEVKTMLKHHLISCHGEDYYGNPKGGDSYGE